MAALADRVVSAAVTAPLARFVTSCRWQEVPQRVRHEAKRSLVNFFATALAGAHELPIEIALRTLAALQPGGGSRVIGRREKAHPLDAAFLNAAAANVFDFDDTHPATIIHPTAPVAPALFAQAERSPVPGEALLLAFVLGAEIECRLGNAVSPGHYRRGWHITSTCGVFGAAVATAKLVGLDERRVGWALGNAAVQSAGLVETLGTMSKSISVGNAARNGLLAALLAGDGFSGPERPLEGERGWLRVVTDAPSTDAVCDGLGQRWELLANTYKPYPCGVVLNPVIDACLDLAADADLALDQIEAIEITGHPLLRERTDRADPKTGRESQVSAQHAVAAALARRSATLDDFSDAAARDPALRALGAKVRFADDARYSVDAARVGITLRSGKRLERGVEQARGGPARPLADAELEAKLRDSAKRARLDRDTAPLLDALWNLDRNPNAATVMALACPDTPR